MVDKDNKIHRSCQTDDGSVKYCSGFVSNAAIECVWNCEWSLPANARANGRQVTWIQGKAYEYAPEWTGDCTYSCVSGFDYIVDNGEARCVKCVGWTYNTGTRTCTEELYCETGTVLYNGECVALGRCVDKNNQYNLAYTDQWITRWPWYDITYNFFKPYGAQTEKTWECKSNSGEVEPHSCQFSCKPWYKCSSWNGQPRCIDSDKYSCFWYSALYYPTQSEKRIFSGWWVFYWYHPTEGNWWTSNVQLVSYLDSRDDFSNKMATQATWCYSFCDSGYHKAPNSSSAEYRAWYCYSNCKSMSLGAVKKNSNNWLDYHNRNEARWYGWYFYNWKFARNGSQKNWTYVEPSVLDDAIENESWACLWTCRSWIPIENLQARSAFKEYFSYNPSRIYNTCWEQCATGYYFSGYLCTRLSSDQYIIDTSKTITYDGIMNYAGQKLACPLNHRYNTTTSTCKQDPSPPECEDWYRRCGDACVICPEWEGFTGDVNSCVCEPYPKCDANHDWLINGDDRQFVHNIVHLTNDYYNLWADLNGDWEVNSNDLVYFDDNC